VVACQRASCEPRSRCGGWVCAAHVAHARYAENSCVAVECPQTEVLDFGLRSLRDANPSLGMTVFCEAVNVWSCVRIAWL